MSLLKRGAKECPTPYLNREKRERFVVGHLRERALTEENLRALARMVVEEMDVLAKEWEEEKERVKGKLEEVERRLARLYEALETGEVSVRELAPRLKALRKRQEPLGAQREELEARLEQRRAQMRDVVQVARYAEDLRGLLMEGNIPEQRAFIQSFVREVVVEGKEAVLRYTVPLPPVGPEERARVLDTVASGGPPALPP